MIKKLSEKFLSPPTPKSKPKEYGYREILNTEPIIPKDSYFGNGFCIEPEVSVSSAEMFGYDSSFPSHNESDCIREFDRLHLWNAKTREAFLEKYKDYYKDKFPIGEYPKASGGVHFHVFGRARDIIYRHELYDYKRSESTALGINMLNCPIFCKKMDNRIFMRERPLRLPRRGIDYSYLEYCIYRANNPNGNPSIEFRQNTVFDDRLIGYYVAILHLAEKEIVFDNKLTVALQRYVIRGEQGSFEDYSGEDLTLDHFKGFDLREKNKEAISKNTNVVLTVLQDLGYEKFLKMLESYVTEFKYI